MSQIIDILKEAKWIKHASPIGKILHEISFRLTHAGLQEDVGKGTTVGKDGTNYEVKNFKKFEEIVKGEFKKQGLKEVKKNLFQKGNIRFVIIKESPSKYRINYGTKTQWPYEKELMLPGEKPKDKVNIKDNFLSLAKKELSKKLKIDSKGFLYNPSSYPHSLSVPTPENGFGRKEIMIVNKFIKEQTGAKKISTKEDTYHNIVSFIFR